MCPHSSIQVVDFITFYQRYNLIHTMLITTQFLFDPKATGSLVTRLGPKVWPSASVGIRARSFRFRDWCDISLRPLPKFLHRIYHKLNWLFKPQLPTKLFHSRTMCQIFDALELSVHFNMMEAMCEDFRISAITGTKFKVNPNRLSAICDVFFGLWIYERLLWITSLKLQRQVILNF